MQHRNVPKIGFESCPYITGRFAVPDQLEFGFDNGGNKDTYGITVGDFPCCESLYPVVVVQRVDFASDKVVEIFPKFNLAFEALFLIGSPCQGVDRTYDSVQCGIG